jgi:hypothetical protein
MSEVSKRLLETTILDSLAVYIAEELAFYKLDKIPVEQMTINVLKEWYEDNVTKN